MDCPKVLFENVTREDADKSVSLLIKYLFNYGFYKFGVEMTLVMLVILISCRQDTMSIVYVIWLCVFIRISRRTKQFIWPIFQFFVMIATIAQYTIMLNLPTILYSSELLTFFFWMRFFEISYLFLNLFIDFQQEFEIIQRLEALIGLKEKPTKLLFDFILLMCICRQQNAFRIEKKHKGKKYPGGYNESSVDDIGTIISGQLPIRTHDFVYPTNWIDVLKCALYFSSYWVTLSVVLLTGTHNISAISLPYLFASFLFSYIGNNFYMKSIRTILKWWDFLIQFNVIVIVFKTIMNLRLVSDGDFLSHQIVEIVHEFLNEVCDKGRFNFKESIKQNNIYFNLG